LVKKVCIEAAVWLGLVFGFAFIKGRKGREWPTFTFLISLVWRQAKYYMVTFLGRNFIKETIGKLRSKYDAKCP